MSDEHDMKNPHSRWSAELEAAGKVTEGWIKDAERIQRRYVLQQAQAVWNEPSMGDFNILHSNVQTMLPAIFGREPVPVVARRHRDPDPIGNLAARILERAIRTEMERDDFGVTMQKIALDLLLVGRGVPWVRFAPSFGPGPDGAEILADARTPIDYVYWRDFRTQPRNSWAEVRKDGWVARRVSMSRRQGMRRFGDKFREVPLRETATGMDDLRDDDREKEVVGRASVWEIWDAASRKVIWLCPGYDSLLDERDDPLGLEGFFPCPMPAFGTTSNASLIPTPDYLQYESLAEELDRQTEQIAEITGALRVAGVYDGHMEQIGNLLSGTGNEMIPISNFQAIGGQGFDNAMKFLELRPIVEALVALYDARERTKQVLYEVSGLSDIMRGQVDPREKLGQSRLKGQFASQRMQAKIQAMEHCARDTLAIKAEIMAEHYEPAMLRSLSGYDYLPEVLAMRRRDAEAHRQAAQAAQEQGMPPPPPQDSAEAAFGQAIQLLKDEKQRGFRLDLETNSTLLLDDDEEKQRRGEFLEAVGGFFERALPLATQMPETGKLLMDMVLFAVRGFRAGRELENSFEQTFEAMRSAEGAGQQPSPEEQAKAQAEQAKMEMEQAKTQNSLQLMQAESQVKLMELQIKRQELEMKAQAEQAKVEADVAMTEAEIGAKMAELDIERQKLAQQLESQRQQALLAIAQKDVDTGSG